MAFPSLQQGLRPIAWWSIFPVRENTKAVAEKIAASTNADLFAIVPQQPYSSEDLDYSNDDCRANKEMNDAAARPEIEGDPIDLSSYDTIFIGYSIWWYVAPTIINTFLESYDFSGKTIVPFATSGGSGFGRTVEVLKPLCSPDTQWLPGKMLNNVSEQALQSWVEKI